MMNNKMLSIMLIVSVCMAMTVPALADWDVIDTTVTILDTETLTVSGMSDIDNGTINVDVGGILDAAIEVESFVNGSQLNVFGTAWVDQFKMYGTGDIVVGDGIGTGDGTLSIVEGFLGKDAPVTLTVNTNGTFIVKGYGDETDNFHIYSGSYIDIVGNGRMLISTTSGLRDGYANEIIAYGGDGTVFSEVIDANTVYTAEPGKITADTLENQWFPGEPNTVTVAMTAEVRNFVDGNGIDDHVYTYSVISGPNDHTASFAAAVESNITATGVDLSADVTFNEIGDYILGVEVYDTGTELSYVDTIAVTVYENACAAVKADLPYHATEALVIGDTNYDCKVDLADFAAIALNWMADKSVY